MADLWGNKARSVLVIASIAVGVFAVGLIAGAYVMLSEDLTSSYEASNPANITLVTVPFDDDLLDAVQRMDGVAAAEGARELTVRVRTRATSTKDGLTEAQWDTLLLVAQPEFARIEIRRRFVQEGAGVPADREIILEHQTLDALGMAIGDTLEIELPDGTLRVMPVVGTAIDQADLQDIVVGGLRGYVTLDSMPWLHGSDTMTKLFVTVSENSDDKAHIRQIALEVTDRLEKSGYPVFQTEVAGTHEHPFGGIIICAKFD